MSGFCTFTILKTNSPKNSIIAMQQHNAKLCGVLYLDCNERMREMSNKYTFECRNIL